MTLSDKLIQMRGLFKKGDYRFAIEEDIKESINNIKKELNKEDTIRWTNDEIFKIIDKEMGNDLIVAGDVPK